MPMAARKITSAAGDLLSVRARCCMRHPMKNECYSRMRSQKAQKTSENTPRGRGNLQNSVAQEKSHDYKTFEFLAIAQGSRTRMRKV